MVESKYHWNKWMPWQTEDTISWTHPSATTWQCHMLITLHTWIKKVVGRAPKHCPEEIEALGTAIGTSAQTGMMGRWWTPFTGLLATKTQV